MKFVELDRRFRRITDAELEDTERFVFLDQRGLGPGIGWADLLKHCRVVLLAEAGAGKTTEMKGRVERLVQEGRFAFFLPLENLDKEPVADILSSIEEKKFKAWKADDGAPAWFFLDAVDELKLTEGKLDRALRRLSKDIGGQLHRAGVIISCRPSDWRPATDLATVKHWLPVPTGDGETLVQSSEDAFVNATEHDDRPRPRFIRESADTLSLTAVQTVEMLPMNDLQIRQFAEQSGVIDATEFIAEIRQQNAWIFAGRPLDLSDLIGTWRSSGHLGTRSEQHETNVKGKLNDDPDRRDRGVLSDAKAQLGAERLALALTLTRTRSIRSPERTADIPREDRVLDAAAILHEWTEEERQTLLRRALFDPATYGRVRFHHRSVQEYLSARHLRTLRERGMSTKSVLRLLFAERYGVEVVFPSMRAIAAWLALWDDAVCKELIRREPEALLSLGDPETLDLATRFDLLREFVARYGQGSWRGFNIEIDQLLRLADPDLAPVIRECWADGPINDDVRHLLVRIIWLGPVPDCADLVQSVAFDATWSVADRIVAIRALVACGRDEVVRQIVDDMLAQPELWPDEIIWGVAADLFPKLLTVDELVTLMEQTPEPANIGGGFGWTSLKIVEALDACGETAVSLRDKLSALIWEGRAATQEFYDIRGRFSHFAPALITLCERQLSAAPAPHDVPLIRCCVVASRFCGEDWSVREPISKLKERFKVNPVRRRDAFWAEVEFMDEVVSAEDDWDRYYQALQDSLVGWLTEGDRPWLMEALADEFQPERRAVALHALVELWKARGRIASELGGIRAGLHDDEELNRIFDERTAPPKSSESIERMELLQRQRAATEHEERLAEEAWRDRLIVDPADAFSHEKREATVSALFSWLYQYKQGSNSCNVWDKEALTQAFGREVADHAEAAFRELWRKTIPRLWSARPSTARNRVPWRWLHGFVGVCAEATTAGWTDSLSSKDARTAVAYATIELGGFAAFIVDLAASHPAEVRDVIGRELSAEVQLGGEDSYLPALQGLVNAETNVKRLFIPRLLDEIKCWPNVLTDETAKHWALHLDKALYILSEVTSMTDREAIAQECIKRYADDSAGPLAPIWLKGLFRFDAPKGAQVLTEMLVDSNDFGLRRLAVEIFATLFGEQHAIVIELEKPAQHAEVIGQLVRLAYAFVRPTEDHVHDSVYSPDARDHAERARNALLSRLVDTPGLAARRVVQALASEEDFANIRDHLELLNRQRTATDAEFDAYPPRL